jgi:hypothetical protein
VDTMALGTGEVVLSAMLRIGEALGAAVAVRLVLALGAGSCGGAATCAVNGRGAVKRPWAGAALGFGAATVAPAAVTPGMEYGGVKGARRRSPWSSRARSGGGWARGEFLAGG